MRLSEVHVSNVTAASVAMPRVSDDLARWRATFWIMLLATLGAKLLLASQLSLFVDEAFYWQESRHLAWNYSDLPPLTAWLIRAGETLFDHSTLALRSLFIAMSLAIVLVVRAISTRHFGALSGFQAGCWALVLPLLASFGVLALPDVPLMLLCLLAMDAFDRVAAQPRRWSFAILLGLWLALAWLTHYRAAMLWLAGMVFLVGTSRGRQLWKMPGLWMAVVIGLSGLLPVFFGDHVIGIDALRFQLLDRHPWSFHADALVQPVEQALVTTPLLYFLLLGALLAAWNWNANWKLAAAPWDMVASVASTFVIGYFVLGLFADEQRFRVHWPLPGYVALLVVLPTLLDRWIAGRPALRPITRLAGACAVLGTALVYAYFIAAATPDAAAALSRLKVFPKHFVGWHEVAAQTRWLLQKPAYANAIVVADNFMLAAEIDYALDGTRPIYSLDHPLNSKHGRAAQLGVWQLDEAGLALEKQRKLLVVVEESAARERDQGAWLGSLCQRIGQLTPLARLDLFGGAKRFAWYEGVVPTTPTAEGCLYPPKPHN